jgi:hypothetical protein
MNLARARNAYVDQWVDEDDVPRDEGPIVDLEQVRARILSLRSKVEKLERVNEARGATAHEALTAKRLMSRARAEIDEIAGAHGLDSDGNPLPPPPEPDGADRALVRFARDLAAHLGAYVAGSPRYAKDIYFLGPASSAAIAQDAFASAQDAMRGPLGKWLATYRGAAPETASESFCDGFLSALAGRMANAGWSIDGLATGLATAGSEGWLEGRKAAATVEIGAPPSFAPDPASAYDLSIRF